MEIPVFTIDAFTNVQFEGNPAAVCLLQQELRDELYQKIAAEMNLSETTFISVLDPSDNFTTGSRFHLRWFTPTTEVSLCGHATLASAAVLFQHMKNVNHTLVFETRSGDLAVSMQEAAYLMDFPLNTPVQQRNETSGRVKGLIITLKGSPDSKPGYDFYSRYFAPWYGIPEDPVTGNH
ncbi:Phenazine biosynthesis-like domain-containing protein [Takifugu flavidus]|uniref:Phenazine biosynthesis-like domain-containing protein n=1 Tax=Takifugu flavidus TaxID=433684 RepID=A0A5C6NIJ5_9TELE|nr:Phenazine biosynthesis-like domain-containing protein [Takifugu flavidus]